MVKRHMDAAQLFGLCGFKNSGKNAAAEHLLAMTGGKSLSFAGPLKDAVSVIFGWDRAFLEGTTSQSREWRETPDPYWSNALQRSVTPRLILQEVGTNVFREYHSSIWLAAATRRHTPPTPSVFTDCRFGNEMHWVHQQQGTVVWVYRPTALPFDETTNANIQERVRRREPLPLLNIDAPTLHLSEYAFLTEGAPFIHVVVENTGSLDDLQTLMQSVYETANDPTHKHMPWGTRTLYVRTEPTRTSQTTVLWQWRNGQDKIEGVLEQAKWFNVEDDNAYGHGV